MYTINQRISNYLKQKNKIQFLTNIEETKDFMLITLCDTQTLAIEKTKLDYLEQYISDYLISIKQA